MNINARMRELVNAKFKRAMDEMRNRLATQVAEIIRSKDDKREKSAQDWTKMIQGEVLRMADNESDVVGFSVNLVRFKRDANLMTTEHIVSGELGVIELLHQMGECVYLHDGAIAEINAHDAGLPCPGCGEVHGQDDPLSGMVEKLVEDLRAAGVDVTFARL
jgi:hypothetical protein